MTTKGRKRCRCRRVLLEPGAAPMIEQLSTVDRLRHTLAACDEYRTMERRAPPDGTSRAEVRP